MSWLAHGVCDGFSHVFLFFDGQIWIDWNGERFVRRFFGFGEIAFFVAKIFEAGLQMERDGIIDVATDFGFLEGVPNHLPFAAVDADNVLVENVAVGPWGGLREIDAFDSVEKIVVIQRVQLSFGGPIVQMRELHVEDDSLQGVHAEVAADEMVVVFGLGTVVAENFQAMGLFFIVCDNHAGIAEAA